jgi:hypothetical protein
MFPLDATFIKVFGRDFGENKNVVRAVAYTVTIELESTHLSKTTEHYAQRDFRRSLSCQPYCF